MGVNRRLFSLYLLVRKTTKGEKAIRIDVHVNGEKVGKVINGEFIPKNKAFEFLDYRMPTEETYTICETNEIVCEADHFIAQQSELFGIDWIYKWINHSIDVVYDGVASEWGNLVTSILN